MIFISKLTIKIIYIYIFIYITTNFSFPVLVNCVIDNFNLYGEKAGEINNDSSGPTIVYRKYLPTRIFLDTEKKRLGYGYYPIAAQTNLDGIDDITYTFIPPLKLTQEPITGREDPMFNIEFSSFFKSFEFQLILKDENNNKWYSPRVLRTKDYTTLSRTIFLKGFLMEPLNFNKITNFTIRFFPNPDQIENYLPGLCCVLKSIIIGNEKNLKQTTVSSNPLLPSLSLEKEQKDKPITPSQYYNLSKKTTEYETLNLSFTNMSENDENVIIAQHSYTNLTPTKKTIHEKIYSYDSNKSKALIIHEIELNKSIAKGEKIYISCNDENIEDIIDTLTAQNNSIDSEKYIVYKLTYQGYEGEPIVIVRDNTLSARIVTGKVLKEEFLIMNHHLETSAP